MSSETIKKKKKGKKQLTHIWQQHFQGPNIVPGSGLKLLVMLVITIRACADGTGHKSCCCFFIPNVDFCVLVRLFVKKKRKKKTKTGAQAQTN